MITSKSTFGTGMLCLGLAVLAVWSGEYNDSHLFLVGGGFLGGLGVAFMLLDILSEGSDHEIWRE